MPRTIKRYGSRKLYDSRSSRYVSLEEIAGWIRSGEDVRVLDNRSGDDVTTQVLAQAIADAGKKGRAVPPKELLHELIRSGEAAFAEGAHRLQEGVERVVQAGVDRIGPVRRLREETASLRERLEELEASLAEFADDAADTKKKQRG